MKKIPFCSLLGAMAALLSVSSSVHAQTAPTNLQLLDKLLASVKPGEKFVRSGDMLLSVERLREMRGTTGGRSTSATRSASSAFYRTSLWPNGRVAYVFDPSLLPAQRTAFVAAAREWETVAQLKFSPRTTENDYILVFRDPSDGSFSNVGRTGGMQTMSLASWANKYTAAHEIAHALGVMHEQSRSNRDNYVSIDFTNVVENQQHNFAIVDNSNNRGVYDFDSVMHYPRNAFAKDGSKPTIITKPGYTQFQNTMGQRGRLSDSDKKGMAEVYGPPGEIVRPSNDNFAKATLIEGPQGSVSGTSDFATAETGESRHAGNIATSSIWYRWRSAKGGMVTFTTKGSAVDTSLAAYLGMSVSTVVQIVSNDNVDASGEEPDLTSSITFLAQANTNYHIAVDSAGESGTIKLNWDQEVSASRYTLSGTVKTDKSQNLGGVTITLSDAETGNSSTSRLATTNNAGEYSFSDLPSGRYNLRASRAGYTFSPTTLTVDLTDDTADKDFVATLIPAALLPELYVSDVSVREGNVGNALVTFNVSLSEPSKQPVSVSFGTANGSALSNSDYAGVAGTLVFAPGTSTLTVNVKLRPDRNAEANENFILRIFDASGARISDAQGTATIINDDAAAVAAPSARSAKAARPARFALLDSSRN